MEGAAAGVSLSLDHVLNEYHLLSETSSRLASKRNLERNLLCKHAPSAQPARPTSHLSLLALSAPGLLSQRSLTRAKCENGAKHAFEDRKPFLKPEMKKKREKRQIKCEEQRIKAQNRARKQKP